MNIGLVPDGGSSWLLPRLIGVPRALQMMMLGERISAAQAADWGLIYKAVDDAALILVATTSAWWWLQRHFTSQLKERGQW